MAPTTAILDATVWTGVEPGVYRDTTIAIDGGQITHVGATRPSDHRAETVIDGSDLFVTPGLVDAHAHTGHRLAVGLGQDVPELEWMDQALGPIGRETEPDDRSAASQLAILESIDAGVTTICEYGTEVGARITDVHLPAGVRTVAVETINEVVDRPSDGLYELDHDAGATARERTDTLFEIASTEPRLSAMYGPQALDMVTPRTMDEVVDQARKNDRHIHMHIAQGGRERRQIKARYGVDSAVTLLVERDWLDARLLAAHLHGATTEQRHTLAEAGVSMVGCPSSIGAIDGIIPPIVEYRSSGGTAALGTDQAPGGAGGHHLLAEARQAWLFAKVARGDPTALPTWEALELATVAGAHALGLADSVGTIEVGKQADLACYPLDELPLAPAVSSVAATPIAALITAGGRAVAKHVLVGGSFLKRDGAFTTLEPNVIIETASDHAKRLHRRAADAWFEADSTLAGAARDGPFSVSDPPQ